MLGRVGLSSVHSLLWESERKSEMTANESEMHLVCSVILLVLHQSGP